MKQNAPVAVLLAIVSASIGLGAWAGTSQPEHPAQPLPTPFPEARYREMSARSPFAIATAPVAAAAATPDFAAQLYVTGVADIGGDDFVSIKTRQPQDGQPVEVFLEVGGTSDDGVKVERVKWSDEMGKTTVDVSKAGERATLAFDEDTIKTAAAPGPVAAQPRIRLPMQPVPARPVGLPIQNMPTRRVRLFPPQMPPEAAPAEAQDSN